MEDVSSGGTIESFNHLSKDYSEWSKNLKKRVLGKDWLNRDLSFDRLCLEAPGEDLPVPLRDLFQEYLSIDQVTFIIEDEGKNAVTASSSSPQQVK